MNNLTTHEFCRRFGACKEGAMFARKFGTMRECYDALLRGEAGENSYDWAIWVAVQNGVMAERDMRLFAVRCARRVQKLMRDDRSIRALDISERYANGEATAEELEAAVRAAREATLAACDAASYAEYAAMDAAHAAAARNAKWAAHAAAHAAVREGSDAKEEMASQFAILAEFGNPFEEAEE